MPAQAPHPTTILNAILPDDLVTVGRPDRLEASPRPAPTTCVLFPVGAAELILLLLSVACDLLLPLAL